MIARIVETKKQEIEVMRREQPGARTKGIVPLVFDNGVNIIAELKRKSPSAGFMGDIDVDRIAVYSRYAKAISVLTDATYFGGAFEVLAQVAGRTHLPVLCKDFIIDEVQIDRAYSAGADIVLLIARILSKAELERLYAYARALGLACLVELHEAGEADKISEIEPEIVGVNARDLDTLDLDIDRTARILRSISAPMRIAESGIRSRQDMERLKCANGFLIGEALMRSNDVEGTFRSLFYG